MAATNSEADKPDVRNQNDWPRRLPVRQHSQHEVLGLLDRPGIFQGRRRTVQDIIAAQYLTRRPLIENCQ
jgi:hypothetical protein